MIRGKPIGPLIDVKGRSEVICGLSAMLARPLRHFWQIDKN
jgi:hypothetical protein